MERGRYRHLAKALDTVALEKTRSSRKLSSKTAVASAKAPAVSAARQAPIVIDDIPTFEIHLKVRIEPGKKPPVGKTDTPAPKTLKEFNSLKPGLDAGLKTLLERLEPKLIRWLGENRKNAILFLVDPVRALVASGLLKDRAQISRLRALRPRLPVPDEVPRSFQISQIEVDVDQG